jgi:hypothetical protein
MFIYCNIITVTLGDLSDCLTLTQHIPLVLSWPAAGLESELVAVTLPPF